jgi:hypothetical protein
MLTAICSMVKLIPLTYLISVRPLHTLRARILLMKKTVSRLSHLYLPLKLETFSFRSMKVLKEEQWQEEVTSKLRSFEKSLIIALKEKGWDGKESEETVTWTFAGGLFYSITVITTIGK